MRAGRRRSRHILEAALWGTFVETTVRARAWASTATSRHRHAELAPGFAGTQRGVIPLPAFASGPTGARDVGWFGRTGGGPGSDSRGTPRGSRSRQTWRGPSRECRRLRPLTGGEDAGGTHAGRVGCDKRDGAGLPVGGAASPAAGRDAARPTSAVPMCAGHGTSTMRVRLGSTATAEKGHCAGLGYDRAHDAPEFAASAAGESRQQRESGRPAPRGTRRQPSRLAGVGCRAGHRRRRGARAGHGRRVRRPAVRQAGGLPVGGPRTNRSHASHCATSAARGIAGRSPSRAVPLRPLVLRPLGGLVLLLLGPSQPLRRSA